LPDAFSGTSQVKNIRTHWGFKKSSPYSQGYSKHVHYFKFLDPDRNLPIFRKDMNVEHLDCIKRNVTPSINGKQAIDGSLDQNGRALNHLVGFDKKRFNRDIVPVLYHLPKRKTRSKAKSAEQSNSSMMNNNQTMDSFQSNVFYQQQNNLFHFDCMYGIQEEQMKFNIELDRSLYGTFLYDNHQVFPMQEMGDDTFSQSDIISIDFVSQTKLYKNVSHNFYIKGANLNEIEEIYLVDWMTGSKWKLNIVVKNQIFLDITTPPIDSESYAYVLVQTKSGQCYSLNDTFFVFEDLDRDYSNNRNMY